MLVVQTKQQRAYIGAIVDRGRLLISDHVKDQYLNRYFQVLS